jgi:hypothetical protein
MKDNANRSRIYWAVMKAYSWSVVKVYGMESATPKNQGLAAFIPLFDSYEAALEFAGKENREQIAEMICQELR